MKYDELVKDNGFLTKAGEKLVAEKFEPATKEILDIATTENQKRIIGGILQNIIGKTVSNIIQEHGNKNTAVVQHEIVKAVNDTLKEYIPSYSKYDMK